MYFVAKIFIVSLLWVVPLSIAQAQPTQLEDLLNEADNNNPSLQGNHEQIASALHKIDQVRSLADPVISVTLSNYPTDSFKTNQTAMTGNEIRLAQKFPFPGKLDTRGNIAKQKSQWFASVYQDNRLQVRGQVKDAWYRLIFQRQAIELTNSNLQVLDDFIKMTEVRYEVGKGRQQDVLKAHLQRSLQLDKLLSLRQQEKATLAELNSLTGRETDQALELEGKLDVIPSTFELNTLQRQAEQRRPMFKAYTAFIEQYKGQRELARLDYKPDFTLWAGYRWRDDSLADNGADFVSAGISFNLPVRQKRRSAAVAEADSSLRVAIQKRNQFRNQLHLDINRTLTRFEYAGELADLYQSGIIPQANQTFQSTLSAYQVNQASFLDLLDSLMVVYRYKIDLIKAISDQQRSMAKLAAAAGLEVDQLSEKTNLIKG